MKDKNIIFEAKMLRSAANNLTSQNNGVRNMFKKTLLGSAVTALLTAGVANAGLLEFNTNEVNGAEPCNAAFPQGFDLTNCGTVTFADEIFGVGSSGEGIENPTRAQLQNLVYTYDPTNAQVGGSLAANDTIKLTVTITTAEFDDNLTDNQFQIGGGVAGAGGLAAGDGFSLNINANELSLRLDAVGAAVLNTASSLYALVDDATLLVNATTVNPAANAAIADELTALGVGADGSYIVGNLDAQDTAVAGSTDAIVTRLTALLGGAPTADALIVIEVVSGDITAAVDTGLAVAATNADITTLAEEYGQVEFNFRTGDSNNGDPGALINVTPALGRASAGFQTDPQDFITLAVQVDAADTDARDQSQTEPFVVHRSGQAVTVDSRGIEDDLKAINVGDDSSSRLFSDLTNEFQSTEGGTGRLNAIGAVRVNVREGFKNADALNDFGLNPQDQVGLVIDPAGEGTWEGLSDVVLVDLGASTALSDSTDADVYAACQALDPSALTGTGRLVFDITNNEEPVSVSLLNENVNRNYAVCLVADTQNEISEITINATDSINYSNARYVDSTPAATELVTLFKNGCRQTVFNLPRPRPQAADNFFIRLTNTSSNTNGAVNAYMYLQDGTRIPADGTVRVGEATLAGTDGELAAHAALVINSRELDAAFGGGITELEDGDDDLVTWPGRSRLVMLGEFEECEALGLVRTSDILTNMTATTQGNEEEARGNNGN